MPAKTPDAAKLDVAAFTAARGESAGQWPLGALPRLAASVLSDDTGESAVHWQVAGEQRPVTGGEPEIWLHLTAQACVAMTCQRCLAPLPVALDIDRRIRFVRGSAQAEALDAELEEDVLELPRFLDLRELVEDELLLELPIVPRHEACPQPLPVPDAADDAAGAGPADGTGEGGRPHPFAVLAQLRKKPGA